MVDNPLKQQNKQLVDKFPFLLPRNRWTGEVVPNYDYDYTELDEVPDGWRSTALDMCEELKEELDKSGITDKYRISQIKEKWGYLRWYDFGNTPNGSKIINRYCSKTGRICIECGRPAEYVSLGWISPYCKRCAYEELPDDINFNKYYMKIEEYYNDEKENEEPSE